MPFRYGVDQSLIAAVLFEALFDFSMCRARSLEIAFVYHYDIGKIEHDDFLQLQSASVIGVHYKYRLMDDAIFLKWHGFLASPYSFDNHVIESRPGE